MQLKDDLLAQIQRRYPDYLKSLVDGTCLFPLEIRIGKTKLGKDYTAYQRQLQDLRAVTSEFKIKVEWETVQGLRFGSHERPVRAWFEGEEDFVDVLGQAKKVQRFKEDAALLLKRQPVLRTWAPNQCRTILEQQGNWQKLLDVVEWLLANPHSGLYTRQIPVVGVDTKFIERHQNLIEELVVAIGPDRSGENLQTFEERMGLHPVEPLIRFRFLDSCFAKTSGFSVEDVSVPLDDFRNLSLGHPRVIITENLRNFLALPEVEKTLAIYGAGNAVNLLAGTPWLMDAHIDYWGDIDAHGFVILGRVRAIFPQTMSMLMDLKTWEASQDYVVAGAGYSGPDPTNLTPEENSLYQKVKQGCLRLEQERIPFPIVTKEMRNID